MNNPTNSSMSGKTLRINLSTGWTKVEDFSEHFDDYMGHYAPKILYDELLEGTTPFDPRNIVILSCGPLMGTLAPGACKMSMSTLSPVTGGWGSGSSDSHVGLAMKATGYDNLIIEGRAKKPSYLYLTEDGIEIRDASFLWGKTTWETLDLLREELNDPKLHVLSIGPAGENLSRNACVMQDRNRAFGRCGTGAVLGNLSCFSAVSDGKISGNITAQRNVELLSGAVLVGDVNTAYFSMRESACLKGNVRLACDEAAATKAFDGCFDF